LTRSCFCCSHMRITIFALASVSYVYLSIDVQVRAAYVPPHEAWLDDLAPPTELGPCMGVKSASTHSLTEKRAKKPHHITSSHHIITSDHHIITSVCTHQRRCRRHITSHHHIIALHRHITSSHYHISVHTSAAMQAAQHERARVKILALYVCQVHTYKDTYKDTLSKLQALRPKPSQEVDNRGGETKKNRRNNICKSINGINNDDQSIEYVMIINQTWNT